MRATSQLWLNFDEKRIRKKIFTDPYKICQVVGLLNQRSADKYQKKKPEGQKLLRMEVELHREATRKHISVE